MTTAKEPPNGSKSPSFFRSVVDDLIKIVIPSKQRERGIPPKPLPQRQVAPSTHDPSNSTFAPSRCEFTFSDGRQCRNQRASLCAHHSSKRDRKRGAKGINAPELEALCSDLTTATNVNRALAQTFLLMAQGRISRKDAVAFAYLSQLMLQSVSGVRAEYVAAFGYRQWENKLKTSLIQNADEGPEPSPGGDNTHSAVSFGKSDDSARTVIPSERSERGIPPKPFPVNNSSVDERPLAERIMGQPDYADILSRSLDMLDRKYDFTPEGRSEAQKLALELELIKPAPAKPAKDFFGQTVDLVRRFRDAEERNGAGDLEASALPPEAFLNYYGHPIKLAVPPESGTATPGYAPPSPSTSRPQPPTMPDSERCSSGRGETIPEEHRSCTPSASDPADFVAPPSRRHRKPRSHSSAPGCASHSELPSPLPISATTAKPDSAGGPDDEHQEGHQTDWYAPPLWSNTKPPDPFPSRTEKLLRKIRGLTNSAFRRLQHQNSRGFSTKHLQKLTP
jgi:hypothetical protein